MHGPRCWGSAFCKNKHRKGKRRVPEGEGRRLSSAGFAPPAAEELSWPSRRFPRTPQEITERRHISTGQIWVLCRAKCDFFFPVPYANAIPGVSAEEVYASSCSVGKDARKKDVRTVGGSTGRLPELLERFHSGSGSVLLQLLVLAGVPPRVRTARWTRSDGLS